MENLEKGIQKNRIFNKFNLNTAIKFFSTDMEIFLPISLKPKDNLITFIKALINYIKLSNLLFK